MTKALGGRHWQYDCECDLAFQMSLDLESQRSHVMGHMRADSTARILLGLLAALTTPQTSYEGNERIELVEIILYCTSDGQ